MGMCKQPFYDYRALLRLKIHLSYNTVPVCLSVLGIGV